MYPQRRKNPTHFFTHGVKHEYTDINQFFNKKITRKKEQCKNSIITNIKKKREYCIHIIYC